MTLSDFQATADVVGGRIRLSWTVTRDGNEPFGEPDVVIRRKTRDFEFPVPPQDEADPFLAYDSGAFPPPGATLADPAFEYEGRVGGRRIIVSVDSAVVATGDAPREVARRTVTTTLDDQHRPVARKIEVLDLGLDAQTVYYYRLESENPSARFMASARAGAGHAMGRKMHQLLPAVHRRYDTVSRPTVPGTEAMEEALGTGGQLRRLLDLPGVGLDFLRSGADGLRDLRDVDNVDSRFLPLLASWIGWEPSFNAPIPLQRHEIKYAAALYRITGTIPGTMIWVKRLTFWPARIKEFHRNVFFSNHVPDPQDPADNGSRTVDTSDPALLAGIKTFDDRLDYTYDAGTTDDDWYAYNVIGIFVTPGAEEPVADVLRKLGRLESSRSHFVPVNVRAVVIVEHPRETQEGTHPLDLLHSVEDEI